MYGGRAAHRISSSWRHATPTRSKTPTTSSGEQRITDVSRTLLFISSSTQVASWVCTERWGVGARERERGCVGTTHDSQAAWTAVAHAAGQTTSKPCCHARVRDCRGGWCVCVCVGCCQAASHKTHHFLSEALYPGQAPHPTQPTNKHEQRHRTAHLSCQRKRFCGVCAMEGVGRGGGQGRQAVAATEPSATVVVGQRRNPHLPLHRPPPLHRYCTHTQRAHRHSWSCNSVTVVPGKEDGGVPGSRGGFWPG